MTAPYIPAVQMAQERNFLPQDARESSGRRLPSSEAASRSYRYLSRVVDREYPRGAHGVVLAFSCPDGDQLSTDVLLMQAYALQAELESPVLLVDARVLDQGGGLTQRLGMQEFRGYADVLEHGPTNMDGLIQASAVAGIAVLPMGGPATTRMSSLRDNLAALLAWARPRYGHVLLQVGSVLADTRNLVTAVQADAVLLLAHEHRTMMTALNEAQDVLRANGARDVRALLVTAQP